MRPRDMSLYSLSVAPPVFGRFEVVERARSMIALQLVSIPVSVPAGCPSRIRTSRCAEYCVACRDFVGASPADDIGVTLYIRLGSRSNPVGNEAWQGVRDSIRCEYEDHRHRSLHQGPAASGPFPFFVSRAASAVGADIVFVGLIQGG